MRNILFVFMASFLLQFGAYAEDANDDVIEVIATGIGKDSDGALKNALRAAVEQAVGTMIDSETLAKNDEVITDQILSYSGGFVESHKVIGVPKIQDGLVGVKVAARVKQKQLRARLTAAKLTAFSVDGGNLFGEATTKEQEKEAGMRMLKQVFQGFPENVLEAKVISKPQYDADKKKTLIEVELSVNRRKYRSFVNKLMATLDQIAVESHKHKVNSNKIYSGLEFNFNDDIMKPHQKDPILTNHYFRIILCPQLDDKKNGIITVYHVSRDNYLVIAETVGFPQVSIDILDKDDEVLASDIMLQYFPWYSLGDYDRHEQVIFFPPLLNNWENPNWRNYDTRRHLMYPGTDGVRYISEISIPAEEIRDIKNIICKIDKTQETISSYYRLEGLKQK
jgi:hypothetical protein